MSKLNKNDNFLYKSAAAIFCISLLVSAGMIIKWIISQYSKNHNLSAYLLVSIESIALPLIMFGAAYFSSSLKKHPRVFEAVVASMLGLTITSTLGMLRLVFNIYRFFPNVTSYWQSILQELGFLAISFFVYCLWLYAYRRQQK